jgi:hypothetical protein
LTYLGRAYLETGQDVEARRTLERAVKLDRDDPLAQLYLGIAMLKTGENQNGRREIEAGLRAIDDTLEYIAADPVFADRWPPALMNGIGSTNPARSCTQKPLCCERRGGKMSETWWH